MMWFRSLCNAIEFIRNGTGIWYIGIVEKWEKL